MRTETPQQPRGARGSFQGGLPSLADVLRDPALSSRCPTVADILANAASSTPAEEQRELAAARQKFLEQAAKQKAQADASRGAAAARAELLPKEEQFLRALASWLEKERAVVRSETEDQLRAAFHKPPSQRRALIEVQRQKWRAVEESVRQLDECARDVIFMESEYAGLQDLRETRAAAAIQELEDLDGLDVGAREKVRILQDLKETFGNASPKRTRFGGSQLLQQHDSAWQGRGQEEERLIRASESLAEATARQGGAEESAPSLQVVEQMRRQQLDIAVAAVMERQSLVQANALARREMYDKLWWNDTDAQRLSAARQCIGDRAMSLLKAADEEAATAVGLLLEQLNNAQQRLPLSDSSRQELHEDQASVQAEFEQGLEAVSTFKASSVERARRLAGEVGAAETPGLDVLAQHNAHNQARRELQAEQDRIEASRSDAVRRIRLAEAELERLRFEAGEAKHDLYMRWTQQIGEAAREERVAQAQRRALEASVEDQLYTDPAMDAEQTAQAAQAMAAKLRAKAEEERRLAEEEQQRVAAALKEAEDYRLVPVRLRIPGLRMNHIRDVPGFQRLIAEQLRASLDLDESQLRVVEISEATG